MSALAKAISITLAVMAVISLGYTAYFAHEYMGALSALADFDAKADIDSEHMKYSEEYDVHYFLVNITLINPSSVDINVYSIELAGFLINVTTMSPLRMGEPTRCFCEYAPIRVKAESEVVKMFYVIVDNPEDVEWNLEHSQGKNPIQAYMEVRYDLTRYDMTSMIAYGYPFPPCQSCEGRGPLE